MINRWRCAASSTSIATGSPSIDDGARTPEDGLAMLRGCSSAGFSTVVATPHMRPGMFDNDTTDARRRVRQRCSPHLDAAGDLPDGAPRERA